MKNKDKNIYLIGGAPTVGKSTIAQALARHFDIPWISTDQIRDLLRTVAKRSDYPKLFNGEGYDAEKYLTEFSAEQIVDKEMEQGDVVWIGIKGMIEQDYTWVDGFVVEGVNILPHLVDKDFASNKRVKAVFLVDEDADRTRDVVFNRGLWADAKTYSDDVKEKEVEWAQLFSHRLKQEAQKYGFPVIEVKKDKDDLQAVLEDLE